MVPKALPVPDDGSQELNVVFFVLSPRALAKKGLHTQPYAQHRIQERPSTFFILLKAICATLRECLGRLNGFIAQYDLLSLHPSFFWQCVLMSSCASFGVTLRIYRGSSSMFYALVYCARN